MAGAGSKTDAASEHDQQVAKLRDEVESLRGQVKRSQRMASLGTMAAMIAHEFNNILTPIISYAHLAKKNPALSEKAIAKAADGGERARLICRAILGMSAGDRDAPVECRVADLVTESLLAIARHPQRDEIDLKMEVPEGLHIKARPIEFQHVVLNLLLNARRAVLQKGARGHIEISARVKDDRCELSVRDSGVGIPPENIDKVFEPFFSTNRSSDADVEGGFGLGLTICREIIKGMDGTISVQSTLGEGTTFTLSLPLGG